MPSAISRLSVGSLLRYLLVAVPIMLACALSPTALIALHVDYIVPGGSAVAKVHPATYAACFSLVIFFLTGFSGRILNVLFFNETTFWYYFFALIILFAYAVLFLSVPFMNLIDVWLFPGIVIILITCLDMYETWLLARTIDVFMIANSLLGLKEVGSGWRLVPLTQWSSILGQWIYPHEWRATAFFGHPLSNSFVIGTYLLSILLTRRFTNLFLKCMLMGFHFIVLCGAFGSRSAAALFVLAFVIYLVYEILRAVNTGRISKQAVVYAAILVPSVVVVLPLILASGYVDRYIERFTNDEGSALARSVMLDILFNFSVTDLITGVPARLFFETLGRYNVVAIESLWLNFLFLFGIIGCSLFFPAIVRLAQVVRQHSSVYSYYLLLYFFGCCTIAVSLGAKTTIFGVIVAICMTSLDYGPLWAKRSKVERVRRLTSPDLLPAGHALPKVEASTPG